jgi:hypothetical protein
MVLTILQNLQIKLLAQLIQNGDGVQVNQSAK